MSDKSPAGAAEKQKFPFHEPALFDAWWAEANCAGGVKPEEMKPGNRMMAALGWDAAIESRAAPTPATLRAAAEALYRAQDGDLPEPARTETIKAWARIIGEHLGEREETGHDAARSSLGDAVALLKATHEPCNRTHCKVCAFLSAQEPGAKEEKRGD